MFFAETRLLPLVRSLSPGCRIDGSPVVNAITRTFEALDADRPRELTAIPIPADLAASLATIAANRAVRG
jgi:hypothetical protein